MEDIFELAKTELAARRPEWAQLIRTIPLIKGAVESSPGSSMRGWTIRNSWYHANQEVAHAFWNQVFTLCDERRIRRKAEGIASGRGKRGRTVYYRGFVFTKS